MFKRRLHNEAGATLVIVLVVISVFGLVVSGLLTESAVSVKYTNAVSARQAKVYAADAGVSLGIQQVRQDNTLCPGPGKTANIGVTTPLLTPASANVPAVNVQCTGTVGSALGAAGHAIMIYNRTDNTPGVLNTQSGSGQPKVVTGPVFVEGALNLQSRLLVSKGDVRWKPSSCSPTPTWDSNLSPPDSGYGHYCVTAAPPLPDHDPPSVIPPGNPALSTPVQQGLCWVFSPGHYTAKPQLQDGNNYFTSGFYYFDFLDNPATPPVDESEIKVTSSQHVWAGKPASTDEPDLAARPACANDPGETSANPYPKGSGAVFAFGQGAHVVVDGEMEIFPRNDPTGAEGTTGLSIVGVPNDWAGWTRSLIGTQLVNVTTGGQFVVHGLVYARDQKIVLWATNGMTASLVGGVVANELDLQRSACSATCPMEVTIAGDNPLPRYVKIKATVPGDPGDKAVESIAIIKLDDDISVGPTIVSWRTGGIVDPTT